MFVSKNGDGRIQRESIGNFLEGHACLYVSARDGEPLGNAQVATRAEKETGKKHASGRGDSVEYALLSNNCHTFVSFCITGRNSSDATLTAMKSTAKIQLGVMEWLRLGP